jgi:hypothetical protein
MKTALLFIFTFLSTLIHTQCTEVANNFGNNTSTPSYNISGDVSVTLNTNNTITLNLGSNFSTASGPDVRAYLINSNGMTDEDLRTSLISNLENIEFAMIGASGAQNHTVTIPNDKDITQFNKVFFYCLQFNAFWDVGTFTSFSSGSCAVLSTEENTFKNFKVYPNPAKDKIQLSNIDMTQAEIRIFDVLGKQVYQQSKRNANYIDISHLKSGIYLLSITESDKSATKKLIIQ